MTPPTSVVVVTYNSEDNIRDCITSIKNDPSVDEIIIIDNNSNDGTVEIANELKAHTISLDKNRGFGSAVNTAIEQISNDYFCCVNPDTMAESDAVTELVTPLTNKKADITTAAVILESDRETISSLGRSIHFSGISNSLHYGESILSFSDCDLLNCTCISGAAFATSKRVWNDIGGFDPELFMYKEDVLFSWDAIASGYNIKAVPSSHIYHEYDGSGRLWKLSELEKSRYYLLQEYFTPTQLVLLSPSLIFVDLLHWLLFIQYGAVGVSTKLNSLKNILLQENERRLNDNLICSIDGEIDFKSIIDRLNRKSNLGYVFILINYVMTTNWKIIHYIYKNK
jgi:GT2 family glycosyltransferase